jgi:hypothetical protein
MLSVLSLDQILFAEDWPAFRPDHRLLESFNRNFMQAPFAVIHNG